MISFFLFDLEPLRRRLPAGESWLEGGAGYKEAMVRLSENTRCWKVKMQHKWSLSYDLGK